MLHGTTPARASLARALSTTTIHRRMLLPEDLADHLLADEDEVLLALPGIPDDAPSIILVTTREVVLGLWKAVGRAAKGVTRKRAVPAGDIGGADYRPGLYHTLTIAVRSGRYLSIEPCTAEDGIRFAHALHTLATPGRVPPPLAPAEVVRARPARGNDSPDSPENRMRAAWDRALLASTDLWNCEEVHSGPALGWLQPGEHTLLVLLGQVGVSTEYLAATDRRVMRGRAPGRKITDHPAAAVRGAVFDEGRFKDVVRVQMHDGATLTLGGIDPHEGREFVEALNTLVATGSLPQELLPFR